MESIRGSDISRQSSVRELLNRLVDEKETGEKKRETSNKQKPWKFPSKWNTKVKRGQKQRDSVVVFYLNIKGELESPIIVPLYSGNMVIIRNKVYEVDPRAFWVIRIKGKINKALFIKEIDRRPVSNLDYAEIRSRGDATDSDEFLIKAALRAQTAQTQKKMNKGMIVIIVIIVIAALAYFFFASK